MTSKHAGYIPLLMMMLPAIGFWSCSSGPSDSGLLYNMALDNGKTANEGFRRCMDFTQAWLGYADPASGLIPQNLGSGHDIWNAHNSAADNYPFMVLTSYILDDELFNTTMRKMLETETLLTSRINSLPDAYSFSRASFVRDEVDTGRIVFGTSEYMKDGLVPLTEYLGPSPWSERMLEMLDDLQEIFTVARNMDDSSFHNPVEDEINGELLQILSRVFWMTGEENYLQWAIEIGDHYLLEKNLHEVKRLRLRDHGCEIIAGLSELYVALHYQEPEKADAYKPNLYRVMERILEVGRNQDGMFYNEINMLTGEILDSGIVDNWGYIYNAYYAVYLMDQREDFREAVLIPLKTVNRGYRNFNWENGSADGFADAIESGINLYNREPVTPLSEWIDSEIRVMWSLQDSSYRENALQWKGSGIIEGWHGDGNFARTSLMYCLWKTQDMTIQPWREDVVFGAVEKDGILHIAMQAGSGWEGLLKFGTQRHRTILNLPLNYPRINQFPEWYSIREDEIYMMKDGIEEVFNGRELIQGLPVKLEADKPYHLKIRQLDP